MSVLKEIIRDHLRYRKQILKLAKSDLIKTYKGAALGWIWAFLKPAITIFIYYFAFTVGLRRGTPVNGFSFFHWLITGMIPWFYVSGMISGGTTCVRKYSYLVTKIRYPVSTIPTFVSLSQLVVHMVLMVILMVIYICAGHAPSVYWLQLPVYTLMMFLFMNAWGLFAGLVSVVSRDFAHLVRSSIIGLFWFSGVLYNVNRITSPGVRKAMLINPVTIIANGYRNCFINHVWFWETWPEIRNFFIAYAVMILLALWAYKRLIRVIPDVM